MKGWWPRWKRKLRRKRLRSVRFPWLQAGVGFPAAYKVATELETHDSEGFERASLAWPPHSYNETDIPF